MKEALIVRDWLAIERTKLANERTLLSYYRTAFGLLGTGVTILKLDLFEDMYLYGWILSILSPFVFVFGTLRWLKVEHNIKKMYTD
jgi:putative membrane protein